VLCCVFAYVSLNVSRIETFQLCFAGEENPTRIETIVSAFMCRFRGVYGTLWRILRRRQLFPVGLCEIKEYLRGINGDILYDRH
jgi:hypothetical protein